MQNNPPKRFGIIFSSILVGTGVVLLGLSLVPGVGMKITLPLIFLMSGTALIFLVFFLVPRSPWAAVLFIPGCLLLAFGMIFLVNVLTGDWHAWAYAWLFLIAGIGVGLLLTGRWIAWRKEINLVAGGLVVLGIVFFSIFGAIAGGLFIEVMAPVLLVAGGFLLRWFGPEKLFAGRLFHKEAQPEQVMAAAAKPAQASLIDPLSEREIEVLHLIGQGLSNMEIASHLTLAQSTVKTHINNLYSKLEVQTRTQAIKRGRELGLLND